LTGAKPYAYLIVGAGLFGATVARTLTDAGYRVLVIERRDVIGGNVYSERVDGLEIHRYGPHILHAQNDRLWAYLQRFTPILPFTFRVKARSRGRLYSFPINLQTLTEVFGVTTPDEAVALWPRLTIPRHPGARDARSWLHAAIGVELTDRFLDGYSRKQWQRSLADLDESVVRRLPIRWTERDDRYFPLRHQGLPALGYTGLVARMLAGIEVRLRTPFEGNWREWRTQADQIVYSGALDQLFGYTLGRLEYRTTRFERTWHDTTFQGCPAVNECDADIPYTRTIEYKYFPPNDPATLPSLTVREYPIPYTEGAEPLYPVPTPANTNSGFPGPASNRRCAPPRSGRATRPRCTSCCTQPRRNWKP